MSGVKAFCLTVFVAVVMVALDLIFHRGGSTFAMATYGVYLGFRAGGA